MGTYYVIVVKRGKVETEVIRTTSKLMYETLMEVLSWANPVSLFTFGNVKELKGKHWTGRDFGKEVLGW
jgi:hypothetical protein